MSTAEFIPFFKPQHISSTLVVFHSWELCSNELSMGSLLCEMAIVEQFWLKYGVRALAQG